MASARLLLVPEAHGPTAEKVVIVPRVEELAWLPHRPPSSSRSSRSTDPVGPGGSSLDHGVASEDGAVGRPRRLADVAIPWCCEVV